MKRIELDNVPYFQGDLMVMRVAGMPAGVKVREAKADDGRLILAHSETGHHHVIDSRNAQLLIDETNDYIAWLKIAEPCEIEHLRSFDTHEGYVLDPGVYELRRGQIERSPEGWRRAAD